MLFFYANIQPPAVVQPETEDKKGKNLFRIEKLHQIAAAVKAITVEQWYFCNYFNGDGGEVAGSGGSFLWYYLSPLMMSPYL